MIMMNNLATRVNFVCRVYPNNGMVKLHEWQVITNILKNMTTRFIKCYDYLP